MNSIDFESNSHRETNYQLLWHWNDFSGTVWMILGIEKSPGARWLMMRILGSYTAFFLRSSQKCFKKEDSIIILTSQMGKPWHREMT